MILRAAHVNLSISGKNVLDVFHYLSLLTYRNANCDHRGLLWMRYILCLPGNLLRTAG